ncbi:unnamed protein product [Calicophoron daubneyi]|uniref:C2H2-type domain-containing protein n=1 Tax=Calicophoron daubneyi TaxID=300641 RepID=A0AAV2T000_CALDB
MRGSSAKICSPQASYGAATKTNGPSSLEDHFHVLHSVSSNLSSQFQPAFIPKYSLLSTHQPLSKKSPDWHHYAECKVQPTKLSSPSPPSGYEANVTSPEPRNDVSLFRYDLATETALDLTNGGSHSTEDASDHDSHSPWKKESSNYAVEKNEGFGKFYGWKQDLCHDSLKTQYDYSLSARFGLFLQASKISNPATLSETFKVAGAGSETNGALKSSLSLWNAYRIYYSAINTVLQTSNPLLTCNPYLDINNKNELPYITRNEIHQRYLKQTESTPIPSAVSSLYRSPWISSETSLVSSRPGRTFSPPLNFSAFATDQSMACPICRKCFRFEKNLLRHLQKTHATGTGESVLKCKLCNYTTKHYSNMYVHIRTHTGDKPYSCAACGVSFTQGSSLKLHIKSRHQDNGDYFLLTRKPGKSNLTKLWTRVLKKDVPKYNSITFQNMSKAPNVNSAVAGTLSTPFGYHLWGNGSRSVNPIGGRSRLNKFHSTTSRDAGRVVRCKPTFRSERYDPEHNDNRRHPEFTEPFYTGIDFKTVRSQNTSDQGTESESTLPPTVQFCENLTDCKLHEHSANHDGFPQCDRKMNQFDLPIIDQSIRLKTDPFPYASVSFDNKDERQQQHWSRFSECSAYSDAVNQSISTEVSQSNMAIKQEMENRATVSQRLQKLNSNNKIDVNVLPFSIAVLRADEEKTNGHSRP